MDHISKLTRQTIGEIINIVHMDHISTKQTNLPIKTKTEIERFLLLFSSILQKIRISKFLDENS